MPPIWIFITALSIAAGTFAVYIVHKAEKQNKEKQTIKALDYFKGFIFCVKHTTKKAPTFGQCLLYFYKALLCSAGD